VVINWQNSKPVSLCAPISLSLAHFDRKKWHYSRSFATFMHAD